MFPAAEGVLAGLIAVADPVKATTSEALATLRAAGLRTIMATGDAAATVRNMRQNLGFAFLYNALGVPIAAGVLYPWSGLLFSPMIAALAMSLSSVSVVGNALRLRTRWLFMRYEDLRLPFRDALLRACDIRPLRCGMSLQAGRSDSPSMRQTTQPRSVPGSRLGRSR